MFAFDQTSQIIRKIASSQKDIFITFDDGPCPEFTPLILDVLKEENVLASFFVIGEKCRQSPQLLQRILLEGHSVFSHSFNHEYRFYFKNEKKLKLWIETSLADLETQTRREQKVFRPPAGILTPPLIAAAKQLQVGLVLWNHRFYDSVFSWSLKNARRSIKRMSGGDIILLHDRQKPAHRETFLKTLRIYLQELRAQGYHCVALSQSHLNHTILQLDRI